MPGQAGNAGGAAPAPKPKWLGVSQADVDGSFPLRLKGPGRFRLKEDITVGMRPEFRDLGVSDARSLFAVIAIEGDDVVFDLDGHTISMTDEVADLVLEGASLIELGNTPYPTGVFPETFKEPHVPATNVTVRNGSLIGAGHFGVHGVGNRSVLLQHLVIGRVGVGGITLSAVDSGIRIIDCRVVGTTRALRATLDDLTALEMARAAGKKYHPKDFPPRSIVPDGSLITGIHVNGQFNVKLQPKTLPEQHGTEVFIDRCEVTDIVGKTNDYGALLSQTDRSVVTTKTGAIVHAASLCPHLSALGKAQLEELGADKTGESIPGQFVGMGLDVRGHHLKGVQGIRLVALDKVAVTNTRVSHIENKAEKVDDLCVAGTAAGIAIRACGAVALSENDVRDVVMPIDPTRASLVLSE